MDRIYLFPSGAWCWVDMFDWQASSPNKAVEIILGNGWTDEEVESMVRDYYEENLLWLFDQ